MAESESWTPDEERQFRRGLKFRKRDDHAVELFKEARANLADPARVKRILIELGRYYNPYADKPIVDVETARQVVALIDAGEADAAGRILDERLSLYAGGGSDFPEGTR